MKKIRRKKTFKKKAESEGLWLGVSVSGQIVEPTHSQATYWIKPLKITSWELQRTKRKTVRTITLTFESKTKMGSK